MRESYLKASILFSSVLVSPRNSNFFIISLFIMLMSLQQHVHVSAKVLRLWFNFKTEGDTHTKTKVVIFKSSQSRPYWVVEALPLRRRVFLMSSEIFQLRNPGKLYLIL